MITNLKEWSKAALIRAIRTFAEAMLAYIGTGAIVLGDINWLAALSAGGLGAVMAILLALAGLPEVGPVPITPTVDDYKKKWPEKDDDINDPEG